jgi:hypothetical protein
MTRVDPFIAIGRHGIVSLLVGEDEKNIRSGDGHVRSRFQYRLIKLLFEYPGRDDPRHWTRSNAAVPSTSAVL